MKKLKKLTSLLFLFCCLCFCLILFPQDVYKRQLMCHLQPFRKCGKRISFSSGIRKPAAVFCHLDSNRKRCLYPCLLYTSPVDKLIVIGFLIIIAPPCSPAAHLRSHSACEAGDSHLICPPADSTLSLIHILFSFLALFIWLLCPFAILKCLLS